MAHPSDGPRSSETVIAGQVLELLRKRASPGEVAPHQLAVTNANAVTSGAATLPTLGQLAGDSCRAPGSPPGHPESVPNAIPGLFRPSVALPATLAPQLAGHLVTPSGSPSTTVLSPAFPGPPNKFPSRGVARG